MALNAGCPIKVAAALSVVFGGVFVWVSFQCIKSDADTLSQLVGYGFAIGSVFLLGASIYTLFGILIGRRVQVIISVDGITHGSHFTHWDEIAELYGTIYSSGVCIGYTPARRKIYIERKLSTTPLLSDDGYRKLAETVREKISHAQPHVRIDIVPRQPLGE